MLEATVRDGGSIDVVVDVIETDIGEKQVGDFREEARQLNFDVRTVENATRETVVFQRQTLIRKEMND